MYLSLWLCRAKKSDREAVLLHYASGNKDPLYNAWWQRKLLARYARTIAV